MKFSVEIFQYCIVFCTAGSKVFRYTRFWVTKDGAFVVTTSSDDLNYINGEYSINNKGDYFTEYKMRTIIFMY